MGLSYVHLRRFPEAIMCFEKDLAQHPERALDYSNIAHCLDEQGMHEEAIEYCSKAVAIDNSCREAWYNKAVAEALIGLFTDAQQSFRRFLDCSTQRNDDWTASAHTFVDTLSLIMRSRRDRIAASRAPVPTFQSSPGTSIPGSMFRVGDPVGPNWIVVGPVNNLNEGSVLRVFNKRTGEHAAMKQISKSSIMRTRTKDEWHREVKNMIRMSQCPNLLVPYRIEERLGWLFEFSEYLDGPLEGKKRSLREWLEQGAITTLQALRWGIQFCDGMEQAKGIGVRWHYAVKPENVLIDDKLRLRLTDFDMVNAPDGSTDDCAPMRFLAAPAPPEFAPYSPCERFHFSPVDVRNDIYSFGVLFYLMITGRHPFVICSPWSQAAPSVEGDSWEQLHATASVVPIDGPLDGIIERCLAKRVDDRYSTFAILRQELIDEFERQAGSAWLSATQSVESAWQLYHLSVSYYTVDDKESALAFCTRALDIDPTCDGALVNRGVTLREMGETEKALRSYADAILVGGSFSPLAWNNRGTIRQQ